MVRQEVEAVSGHGIHDYEPLIDFHSQDIAYDEVHEQESSSSSSSSDTASDVTGEEESELEEFLLDAFQGFDPREIQESDDIVKVCV